MVPSSAISLPCSFNRRTFIHEPYSQKLRGFSQHYGHGELHDRNIRVWVRVRRAPLARLCERRSDSRPSLWIQSPKRRDRRSSGSRPLPNARVIHSTLRPWFHFCEVIPGAQAENAPRWSAEMPETIRGVRRTRQLLEFLPQNVRLHSSPARGTLLIRLWPVDDLFPVDLTLAAGELKRDT